MVMTEWYELRGGFIEGDIVKWREAVYERRGPKGKKWVSTFGGQRIVRVGLRLISAEVIQGPDEEGWVYLLVRQYDNLGMVNPAKLTNPPSIGSGIKRKYKTIMNGDPHRLLWSDENVRSMLASQFLGNKEHMERFMSMDVDDED